MSEATNRSPASANSNATLLETFWQSDTLTRIKLARTNEYEKTLRQELGNVWYDEYAKIAKKVDLSNHMAIGHATNLIFVPGVMGSFFKSTHLGGVWWLDLRTAPKLERLQLAPNGVNSADPRNNVDPFAVDPLYEPFLAAALDRPEFGHTCFPYDWRKPLPASVAALRDLILKTFAENGGERVNLVAHSMGGLMVRCALMAHGDEIWSKINKIAFVGTPHFGSVTIAGYLKNHLWGFEMLALLGRWLTRPTFRSLWGVLSMLPAPAGVYPGTRAGEQKDWIADGGDGPYRHPCANFDFYQADAWKLGLTRAETTQLQIVLDGAAELHRALYESQHGLPQPRRDRMLMIAGVGYKSLFRLEYRSVFGGWEAMGKVTDRVATHRHRDSDGRVPLASAKLDDVLMRYVRGVHGGLTNQPEVYADVFRWLAEEELQLADSPKAALGEHLAGGSAASEAPTLDGTLRATGDNPGTWQQELPLDNRLSELDALVRAGQLPGAEAAQLIATRLL